MALSSYAAAHHSVKTRRERSFNAPLLISSLSSLTGALAGALVMSQAGNPESWLIGSAVGASLLLTAGLTGRLLSTALRQR